MKCHTCKLKLAGLLTSMILVGNLHADPADWLMKINHAASELSFAGIFIYSHDSQIEAMQVARRVDAGVIMQERLYSLNGEAREVVRDMNMVWCYIPDQKVGVHEYRQTTESGFPRILPDDLSRLKQNYHFTEGKTDRIAARMAKQINVVPNDNYRYGYSLWADKETGLLLRSDLVGANNEIMEQYQFVSIDIGIDVEDSALLAVTSKDKLKWYGDTEPQASAVVERSRWQFSQLPAGYQLSKHIRRMSPMESEEVEHLVFTDGLSSVSIFIKKAHEGQSSMEGLSRMGSVHAFRNTINNHRVTVMGEVPAVTVEYLARGVVYTQ